MLLLSNSGILTSCQLHRDLWMNQMFIILNQLETQVSICMNIYTSVHDTVNIYHWRELPQVSFLSRQKFCHQKTHLLSWQKYACRNKHVFTESNICRDKSFITIILSWQRCCHNKHIFIMAKQVFVVTNTCLLQQKCYLWQRPPMIKASSQETTVRFSQIIII